MKAKEDFLSRVAEIDAYFAFLETIIINKANLAYFDKTEKIDSVTQKILKANSFLLLYNLAESCVRSAIEEIYITLNNNIISYDELQIGIKKEIIRYLKKNVNADDLVNNLNEIAYDIIAHCFDDQKLLSGNLDARKIRELASKYGFSSSVVNVNPDHLFIVKNRRNDLAHGIYSFKECGKDYTIQDLLTIKTQVVEYLNQILDNIADYIYNKKYLR